MRARKQVAVHPVWGCDNEAIKDEFRRLQAERDKYLEWFQKADSELERLHFEKARAALAVLNSEKEGER